MSEDFGSAPATGPTGLPRWVVPTATGLAGFVLGGMVVAAIGALSALAGGTIGAATEPTIFFDALKACNLENSESATVADGGLTLTIESKGDDDSVGIDYAQEQCILEALDVPASVLAHFGQTTSVDGRQEETWKGITLSWSYHPDRGADAVLTYDAAA